jgi:hypothetical protein
MQAHRQNTRQLAALESETLEWFTRGAQWSIVNYGPSTLWFNYSGGHASPGAHDSTKLERGFSFTDSESAPRSMEISLVAEGPLTYVLDTNQRIGAAGIGEAPIDGQVYGRRDGAWIRGAGPAQGFQAATGWFSWQVGYRTLHFGDQLEVIGEMRRITGDPVNPGATPVLMGTFPVGYRPVTALQYRLSTGSAGGSGQFHAVGLVLQNTGTLSVFVPTATLVFYLNEIFDLTLPL